jgi:hypothetical protein
MTLREFAVEKKRAIFEQLSAGQPPSEGHFDPGLFKEVRDKGKPQMGATTYAANQLVFEHIYPGEGRSVIFSVAIDTPDRVVFLPVPEWVVENIWQGDVDGSFHFEKDALALLEKLKAELVPELNEKWFGPRQAKRRE